MTEKRFDVVEYGAILVYRENGRSMWKNEVHIRLNELYDENKQLKQKLKKYEKIEELKRKDFIGCHNCKNDRSVNYDDGTDGMCAIDKLMNLDGCFDTEYHRLPSETICPYWELEE